MDCRLFPSWCTVLCFYVAPKATTRVASGTWWNEVAFRETTFRFLNKSMLRGDICDYECATRFPVPTRGPALFLSRLAAVPGSLALRANFEVLQMAHNLAPTVQGRTLVHVSAQLEPCPTHKNTINTPLTRATQYLRTTPIPLSAQV